MLVSVVEISNSDVHICTSNECELKAQLQTALRSDISSNVGSVRPLIRTSKVSKLRQPVWFSGWTSLKSSPPGLSAALCGCFCHRFNRSGCTNRQLYFLIDKCLLFTANSHKPRLFPMTIIIPPTAAVSDEASGHRDFGAAASCYSHLQTPQPAAADTHVNISAVVH